MVLAPDPDSVLWTDDLIQAQTSAQEFGSRRVWAQIVLNRCPESLIPDGSQVDHSTDPKPMNFFAHKQVSPLKKSSRSRFYLP